MNLVGSYAHHHHHHHHHHHPHPAHPMLHEPFLFGPASRCHQERPYFQSWLLSPADAAPDFPAGGPPPAAAAAAASYGPDARPGQSPGRLEALGGRLGRRKGSGPKKERRRTESINSAFAELRECIPNVPADTKLSKIKTLRLATSYIAYLMDVLAKDAQAGDPEAFKAELKKADGGRESKRKRELETSERPEPVGGTQPGIHAQALKEKSRWMCRRCRSASEETVDCHPSHCKPCSPPSGSQTYEQQFHQPQKILITNPQEAAQPIQVPRELGA